MDSYVMEIDKTDVKRAVLIGFNYLETQDEIVGFIYANPKTMKDIILAMPKDVDFDYIPDGIGILRTAYLKYRHFTANEIRFLNQEQTIELKIKLI